MLWEVPSEALLAMVLMRHGLGATLGTQGAGTQLTGQAQAASPRVSVGSLQTADIASSS